MARTAASKIEDAPADVVEETTPDVSTSPEGWEWETVHDESPTIVLFDQVGETFVGQEAGKKYVEMPPGDKGEDESFHIYLFRGRDGELYGMYESYAMTEGMKAVPSGAWVRITFVSEIPVKKGQPMKNLRFDVRK